jgi:hypothetical protein
VNNERHLQPEKHRSHRTVTEEGMQIDRNDEQSENVCDSICDRFEPDSNVTDESVPHPMKHSGPTVVTELGTEMNLNDEQP